MTEGVVEVRLDRDALLREVARLALLLVSLIAIAIEPDSSSLYTEQLTGWPAVFSLLRDELGEVDAGNMLAAALLAWLYHHELLQPAGARPFCLSACIVGGLLSACMVVGISFSTYTTFDFISYRLAQVPIAAITFIGYWVIIYTGVKLFYAKLDALAAQSKTRHVYAGALRWFYEHFLLFCMCVLLVCWGLQMLPFFPGSVPYDGRYQLNQYFGVQAKNLHHPIAATMLMGLIYDAGSALFGAMGGCVFCVGFQSLYAAWALGRICAYLRQRTGRLGAGLAALAFFGLVPVFWTYLQTIDKDALYMTTFAWFALEYLRQVEGTGGKRGLVQLVAAAALVCAFRKEGALIAIPALAVLVVIAAGWRRVAAAVLAVVVVWNFGWNTLLMDRLGFKAVNQVEGISVCLQMLARYDLYYGDELTDEDRAIIDTVISSADLGERYDPDNADPVKNVGYRNTSDEEWDAFWELWWELFARHPLVYLEAAVNEVFGYLYPFYIYTGLGQYQLYNKEPFNDADTGGTYSTYVFSSAARQAASDAAYSWNSIPLLSWLVYPGAYTWVGVVLLGALLRRRDWRGAAVFVLPVLVVAAACASPVNGYLRYMLPVMASMPLYVLVGTRPYWERDGEEVAGTALQVSAGSAPEA